VEKNDECGGPDEPEECREGGREPEKWESDDEEANVKGLLSDDVTSYLHRLRSEFVDGSEATDEECQRDKQQRVCDDGVNRQDHDN